MVNFNLSNNCWPKSWKMPVNTSNNTLKNNAAALDGKNNDDLSGNFDSVMSDFKRGGSTKNFMA